MSHPNVVSLGILLDNSCVQVLQRLSILLILFFSVITVKKRRCTTAAGTHRTAPSNVSRSTGTPITNVPAAGRDELPLATPLLSTPPIYKPRYWIDHGFLIYSQDFKPQLLRTLTWTFYWVAVNANRTSEHGISHIPRRDGFYVWILTVSLYISLFFYPFICCMTEISLACIQTS